MTIERLLEIVERDGIRYAEVLRSETSVPSSKFFSPPTSSLQLGLFAHASGFFEPPHTHKIVSREIRDVQQVLVVQRGVIAVEFYSPDGIKFHEVILKPGDAILLAAGAHAVRVLEDARCVSIKQGPYLGAQNDKVPLQE